MKIVFAILLIFLTVFNGLSQNLPILSPPRVHFESRVEREYFFEHTNFAKNGYELVVSVQRPQTRLAESIGHRIYSDTNFLSRIESEFYTDKAIGIIQSEILHFCDFDIFFYIKSGENIRFFKKMNSRCGISTLDCDKLGLLAQNGKILKTDTLREIDFNKLDAKKNFGSNLIYSDIVSNQQDWQHINSKLKNGVSKPTWYYDGKIEFEFSANSHSDINRTIDSIFKPIDSLKFKNINYELFGISESMVINSSFQQPNAVKLIIYLDKPYFQYFSLHKIEPVLTRKDVVKFTNEYLLLIR